MLWMVLSYLRHLRLSFPSHCIDHPYFIGIQYHPEYLTRPMKPSPPYLGLILAASHKLKAYIARGCVHSPRSSYDYDLECDLDDEVTQAFRLQLPNDSSLSPAPSPVNLSEQSNWTILRPPHTTNPSRTMLASRYSSVLLLVLIIIIMCW